MYCFGKEKARVKREASDCDSILNKTRYLSCWFSVFSEARKELRNDLPIYCCSFVLEYKSLWQACHRKDETLPVDMFLGFSSQMSHMMCPVSDTDARKPEASTVWGVASHCTKGPWLQHQHPYPFWRMWENSVKEGNRVSLSKFSGPLGGQINRNLWLESALILLSWTGDSCTYLLITKTQFRESFWITSP